MDSFYRSGSTDRSADEVQRARDAARDRADYDALDTPIPDWSTFEDAPVTRASVDQPRDEEVAVPDALIRRARRDAPAVEAARDEEVADSMWHRPTDVPAATGLDAAPPVTSVPLDVAPHGPDGAGGPVADGSLWAPDLAAAPPPSATPPGPAAPTPSSPRPQAMTTRDTTPLADQTSVVSATRSVAVPVAQRVIVARVPEPQMAEPHVDAPTVESPTNASDTSQPEAEQTRQGGAEDRRAEQHFPWESFGPPPSVAEMKARIGQRQPAPGVPPAAPSFDALRAEIESPAGRAQFAALRAEMESPASQARFAAMRADMNFRGAPTRGAQRQGPTARPQGPPGGFSL